ncbi:hypothetical protein GCM10017709_27070 [Glutamicibacter nicotianae]|uniref:Uncharacterized protein n=1 Tax=Glutamicibacter nicotianae TaxID=37929 RepID=A0ABQ0RLM0_GLUNI|nr:hypothetical protein ANI01nite_19010 [Glutamicibacter nicotianae]
MAKSRKPHDRLVPGAFWHGECAGCSDDSRAVKVDLGEGLRTVTRVKRCKSVGDLVVDFSVGVQSEHPDMPKPADVIRGCSSHANYHWHRWDFQYPRRDLPAESLCQLDSVLQVHNCFIDSTHRISGQAVDWREQWLPTSN